MRRGGEGRREWEGGWGGWGGDHQTELVVMEEKKKKKRGVLDFKTSMIFNVHPPG